MIIKKKRWRLLIGLSIIILGVGVLYILIEGIRTGELSMRASDLKEQTHPVSFWILASFFAAIGIANLVVGVVLTAEVLSHYFKKR